MYRVALSRFTKVNIFNRVVSSQKWLNPSSCFVENRNNYCVEVVSKSNDTWDKWFDEDLPRITVPSKMMKRIQKMQLKKQLQAEKERAYRGDGPLIISCKRSQFNHFSGHRYPKGELDNKFLASKGWKHHKSTDDWFIIQPFMHLPAFHGTTTNGFSDLNIDPKLCSILEKMAHKQPTNVQESAIPEILTGNNVLIAAETGSGKTLAYLLPMIQNIIKWKSSITLKKQMNTPLGVIIVPSKELVRQLKSVCDSFCEPLGWTISCLAGKTGESTEPKPMDILISTPGSLAPLAHHKIIRLNQVQCLVLDEGDTLMDDSFSDTVLRIVRKINVQAEPGIGAHGYAQIIIASATMPRGLENILGDLIDMDAITTIKTPILHFISPHIKQKFERVKPSNKSDVVVEIIKKNKEKSTPTLVFCNGAGSVHHLAYRLEDLMIEHCLLLGKVSDEERSERFAAFQNGTVDIMIATDIASRGLDTTRVKHVINFDFPNFISDYIHRVGRVGRVGSSAKCMVSSYITKPWEVDLLWQIERSVRKMIPVEEVDANIKKTLTERKTSPVDNFLQNDFNDLL